MRAEGPRHTPVLLREVLDVLAPHPGRVVVDCTVGLGGHAVELLRRLGRNGKLIGLDLDTSSLEIARRRLEETGGSFLLFHRNFAALPSVLAEAGVEWVDAVLADLGVSSPQIGDPARGFSLLRPGLLDMRMDPTRGEPASKLLDRMSEAELSAAILQWGDETDAPKIARLIVKRRPIRTTQELTALVCEARRFTLERAAGAKLHPATRTFQALRMLVNREIPNLERLLAVLPQCLKPGGIAALISFHSGEDRRVKRAFRDGFHAGEYDRISDDPIIPSEEERKRNPRSRSAKLRWVRRAR